MGQFSSLCLPFRFPLFQVEETFQKDYEDHHRSWQIHRYDWLPNIPKQLGEKVQEEHLRAQSVSFLSDSSRI